MKQYFIGKVKALIAKEGQYLIDAVNLFNTLVDEGIEIPSWFYASDYSFGFIDGDNSLGELCLSFRDAPAIGLGVDPGYLNLKYVWWRNYEIGFDIAALEKLNFEDLSVKYCSLYSKAGLNNAEKGLYNLDDASDLRKGLDFYEANIEYIDAFSAERKAWFAKVDKWLTEMEQELDSDLDLDGKIGESKKARCVVDKILEGANIRKMLCN